MWVTRCTNVCSALCLLLHTGPAVFREVTHTEHQEQGKQSLGKFQTLLSALLLLTDVTWQFYLSSLKAFCLSESFSGTPLIAWVFWSSSAQPWQPWLGFMGTASFSYSAMPCSPCFPATCWQAALWQSEVVCTSISSYLLPVPPASLAASSLFHQDLSPMWGAETEGREGRSRVEQEGKWDGQEEKAEITVE